MSDFAIRALGLSKEYRLGARQQRYRTLRDTLTDVVAGPFRRGSQKSSKADTPNTLWALDDVCFDVRAGEVVGVIGRNGAGKSTLLKILCRITEPTRGLAEIRGRVGALLEVGTGFHPELTGRENLYLNGAILGMSKTEIERKFDEIVDFAEVAQFIDTPVKHYSSGMYLRLAFAVAAHLEPEVLIVDEVLAVGDTRFQEKCLGLMHKTAKTGRTILFVSHNMAAIQSLCSRVILFAKGRLIADGAPEATTRLYLSDAQKSSYFAVDAWPDRVTNGEGRVTELYLKDENGDATTGLPLGGTIRFELVVDFVTPVVDPTFAIVVHNSLGDPILEFRSTHSALRSGRVVGKVRVGVCVENLWLYPGEYTLSPWVADTALMSDIDWVKNCATLTVYPAPGPHGDLKLVPGWGKYWVPSSWDIEPSIPHVPALEVSRIGPGPRLAQARLP
jgi:lipopolysaccharide transport system ATP-binding protein